MVVVIVIAIVVIMVEFCGGIADEPNVSGLILAAGILGRGGKYWDKQGDSRITLVSSFLTFLVL